MSNILELLTKLLNHIEVSPETLNEIEKISCIKEYSANDILYREHERSNHLYIVISGQVDIQYLLTDGRRKTVDNCVPGDFILWSAVVEPHQTNSIGICRAHTELLSIDGQKLLKICEKDTAFGYRFMSLIASVIRRRLQAARRQISFLRGDY